ncbi:MAG: hypothetical protein WCS89_03565 [Candidatus Paceibacterota bacterium]|jgi:hypothetical protein
MKNRSSTILALSLSLVIFTGAVYGYMYYMVDVFLDRIVEAQTTSNSLILTKSQEQSFLESYKSTASRWKSLPNYFVDSGHVVNFIEVIEALGTESGSKVSISSIDSDNLDGAPLGKEGVLSMRITIQGSWSSVMRALSLTETLPYKISIDEIKANTSNESGSTPASKVIWNLSFNMKIAMLVGSSTPSSI